MDRYNGEKVLVFSKHLLCSPEMNFDGFTNITKAKSEEISDILNNSSFYVPRHIAEENDDIKQIIPYVIFKCGDKVFSYVRGKKSGEKRLIGNRSIGIGGHINPIDNGPRRNSASEGRKKDVSLYYNALWREIGEEVGNVKTISEKVYGLIHDKSDPVGRVHFGIVHLFEVADESDVKRKEEQITKSGFISIDELFTIHWGELENWSKKCILELHDDEKGEKC